MYSPITVVFWRVPQFLFPVDLLSAPKHYHFANIRSACAILLFSPHPTCFWQEKRRWVAPPISCRIDTGKWSSWRTRARFRKERGYPALFGKNLLFSWLRVYNILNKPIRSFWSMGKLEYRQNAIDVQFFFPLPLHSSAMGACQLFLRIKLKQQVGGIRRHAHHPKVHCMPSLSYEDSTSHNQSVRAESVWDKVERQSKSHSKVPNMIRQSFGCVLG